MNTSKTMSFTTALVGAAGGALALYLLDPEAGQERRQRLSGLAGEAIDKLKGQIETLAAVARDQAERAHDAAAGAVKDAAAPLQDAAKAHLADAAGVAADARDVVSRVISDAQSAIDELRHRGRHAASALRGEEPSSHVLPVALTAVGFCAAGVGLMWLLDPDQGRTRRARLTQQGQRILNQTSRSFHSTGRHLRNKLTGYSAVAQRTLNEKLAQREPAASE